MMRMRKKAVSPVIAVVLIIALVAAAVGTVWVLIQNYSDVEVDSTVDLSIVGYYDFDGNSKAELIVVRLTPKLNTIGINVSGATVGIENSSYIGESWELLGNSATQISAFETGDFFIMTTDSSEELVAGSEYTVKVTLVAEASLSFTVSGINSVDPLTLEIFSDGSALSLEENILSSLSPEEIELLAASTPLGGVRVVLYNARTGFPVAKMDKNTASDGKVSFKVRPGRYYVKIIIGQKNFKFGPFFHPKDVDSLNKVRRVSIENVFTPVTVNYYEQNVPIQGATIAVREKVTVSGNVYEKVTSKEKTTNINGSVSYVLKRGEYKFLAYSGSTVPAPSEWVDISVKSNIDINVEPGIVYVKILTSSGDPVKNAKVSAYAVVGSKNTYLSYSYTNSTGFVKFSITSSDFLIKVSQGAVYTSSVFKVVGGKTYEYIIEGSTLTVNVQSSSSSLSNIYTYLYNEFGQYYGYGISDSNGQVKYTGLSNGSYYLKYLMGSSRIKTDLFTVSGNTNYNLSLSGFAVYASITSNGSPRVNQYVYAYSTSTNQYLGWARTNSSGVATFIFTNNQSTYLKVSAYIVGSGYTTFTSDSFIPSQGKIINLSLTGIKVTVTVQDQNSLAVSSEYISVFDQSNKVIQSGYTDSNGKITFSLKNNSVYSVGTNLVKSGVFNTSVTASVSLTLNVVSFSINAKSATGSNLANAYIYLYANTSNGWRYSGFQRTDANGLATFSKPVSTNYRVYLYTGSIRLYSNSFTITDGKIIVVQPASFKVEVNVPTGAFANQWVYLYTADNQYVTYARTDSNGNATFSIVNNTSYKVYVYQMRYFSEAFLAIDGGFARITVILPRVQLQVLSSTGSNYQPLSSWEYVRAYFANGSYAGYSYLNNSGAASFYLANNTEYYFYFYKGGREILSSTFNATEGLIVNLTITGNTLTINVNFDNSPVANALVYLYNALNRYFSGWGRTDSNGVLQFEGILNGTYYLYVRTSSIRQTSNEFTVAGDTSYAYNVTTATLTATFYQVNSPLAVGASQRVYLRTLDGFYSGYSTTDSTGKVSFTVADNSTYYIYSYYAALSTYIYSDLTLINGTTTISVRPVRMYIDVQDSATNGVSGMRVYLQKDGIALGYGTTNSTGTATVYGNNGTKYFFTATKSYISYGYTYSNFTEITAKEGLTSSINIGGGKVEINVSDIDGNAASNIYVYLYKPIGQSYQWTGYYGRTDSSGNLVILGVGEGDYVAYVYGTYTAFTVNSALTTVNITL